MLNRLLRSGVTRLLTPIARALLAMGIGPDVVTVIGTLGVMFGALAFFPRGALLTGTLVITAFVFWDNLDGTMARISGRSSRWGAFLDSTLDRLGDGAIFAGLVMFYAPLGDQDLAAWFALVCLVTALLTSYTRSRAEALGMTGQVGIIERAERLVVVLVAAGFSGLFGWPHIVMTVVLGILAALSVVTVLQRIGTVYRQSHVG